MRAGTQLGGNSGGRGPGSLAGEEVARREARDPCDGIWSGGAGSVRGEAEESGNPGGTGERAEVPPETPGAWQGRSGRGRGGGEGPGGAGLGLRAHSPRPGGARGGEWRGGKWDPPRPVSVLLWWEPFGGRHISTRPSPDCRLRFNISGCRLLTDRAAYGEAQAVLFHHRDLVKGPPDWPPPWGVQVRPAEEQQVLVLDDEEEPVAAAAEALAARGPRPPGQRWVWMNFESPSHSPGLRSLESNLFNWTLSYRADSDIFVPYGYLYPRTHPSEEPPGLVPPLARKQRLVAWVVSNWDESQARVRYYRQLSQHVPVDLFGKGGPGQPLPEVGLLHTVARYKFYLAFENSQHLDYITEKLWRNAFLAGAVPVVLGPDRANYERFVPRRAFIHVDDFPDASSLAAHLLFLDRNPVVYRRYFSWRRSYAVHVTSFWDEPWCRACQAVQRAGDQPKSVPNLAGWFER